MKIGNRVAIAGESEKNPGRCRSDVSFHLHTAWISAAPPYETKSEGCFLKGKFIFYVREPACCFSFPDINLAGPLKLFGQVILLSDLEVFLVGCLGVKVVSACRGVL